MFSKLQSDHRQQNTNTQFYRLDACLSCCPTINIEVLKTANYLGIRCLILRYDKKSYVNSLSCFSCLSVSAFKRYLQQHLSIIVYCRSLLCPRPLGRGIKWRCCLTSVCLSHTLGLSWEQIGLGRLKLAQTAHVTRDSDTTFKVKWSRSQGAGAYCGGLLYSLFIFAFCAI